MCFWLINGGKNLHQSTTYFFDFLCLLMCFLFVWKPHVPINAKEHFSNSESMFYCYFFSEINEPFEFGIEIGWFWGQNRHKSHLMKYTLWDGNNLASLIESVWEREGAKNLSQCFSFTVFTSPFYSCSFRRFFFSLFFFCIYSQTLFSSLALECHCSRHNINQTKQNAKNKRVGGNSCNLIGCFLCIIAFGSLVVFFSRQHTSLCQTFISFVLVLLAAAVVVYIVGGLYHSTGV